ncbi:PepSY domain-containing protein, partial [bacterium]|nr:PepSY domain-containing protein [bacterium]
QWQNNLDLNFVQSAVSLISEPHGDLTASVFTEKTIFAIMGLTFPIFVGGVGNADYLKKVGLDVFDDIIDHSYQFLPTLAERCYYALKNNIKILTDLNLAKQLRTKNLDRLLKNRDLLYTGILIDLHQGSFFTGWAQYLIFLPSGLGVLFLLISGLLIYPRRKHRG